MSDIWWRRYYYEFSKIKAYDTVDSTEWFELTATDNDDCLREQLWAENVELVDRCEYE